MLLQTVLNKANKYSPMTYNLNNNHIKINKRVNTSQTEPGFILLDSLRAIVSVNSQLYIVYQGGLQISLCKKMLLGFKLIVTMLN